MPDDEGNMTFKEAVKLYLTTKASKPSDYLFNGEEYIKAYLKDVSDAFGIEEEEIDNLCERCDHYEDCPFALDLINEVACTACNYFEEDYSV